MAIDSRTSKMEMTLYLTETAGGLDGFVEYNTDLFDARHHRRACSATTSGCWRRWSPTPRLRLSELPLLSGEERRQVLVDWNATRGRAPAATLHELIEAQVRADARGRGGRVRGRAA